jgi:hypothetical protein
MGRWDQFHDKNKPYDYLALFEADHRDNKPAGPADPIIAFAGVRALAQQKCTGI